MEFEAGRAGGGHRKISIFLWLQSLALTNNSWWSLLLKLLCEMIGDARWNLNSTSTRDQPGCGSDFNWTLKDTISSSARFVPNTPSELYFLSETTSLPDLKIWESPPPPPLGV